MIISSTEALLNILPSLSASKYLALDTEFMWRNTYCPVLCLIQIATPDDVFLIDTLSNVDLSLLQAPLEDTDIVKIFHACQHDLNLLYTYTGAKVFPIADTQMAAEFLGLIHQGSLKWLLEHLQIKSLEKQEKLSDWSQRPLSNTQLEYAEQDVRHLTTCFKILSEQLKESGKSPWFWEETLYLTDSIQSTLICKSPKKVKGQHKLDKAQQALCNTLLHWREAHAFKLNTLPRKIISDTSILRLAEQQPTHIDQLADKAYKLRTKQIESYKHEIIQIISTPQPEQTPIKNNKLPSIEKEKLDQDYQKICQKCDDIKIIPQLLITKPQFKKCLQQDSDTLNEMTQGWRGRILNTLLQP